MRVYLQIELCRVLVYRTAEIVLVIHRYCLVEYGYSCLRFSVSEVTAIEGHLVGFYSFCPQRLSPSLLFERLGMPNLPSPLW